MTTRHSDGCEEGGPADGLSRRDLLRGAGAALGTGTVTAGAASTAIAQESARYTVGMTDELVFEPAEITISPGDTLVWVNRGTTGHSVTAYGDAIPESADYFASGGFDAERPARRAYEAGNSQSGDIGADERYEHTFEAEGTYEYFCIPHESLGMVGSVTVTQGGAPAEPGEFQSLLPDQALTAAIVGLGATFGVLAFAYVFMKYGFDDEA